MKFSFIKKERNFHQQIWKKFYFRKTEKKNFSKIQRHFTLLNLKTGSIIKTGRSFLSVKVK